MKLNICNQYASSFASLGVIAVIIAFTIQVSMGEHQLSNHDTVSASKDTSLKKEVITTAHICISNL
jgi:hypothetical protein